MSWLKKIKRRIMQEVLMAINQIITNENSLTINH